MPDASERYLAPSQVAELLSLDVDEVLALVLDGRLRGSRLGEPARWRIEESSVGDYLADRIEESRRMALWEQSNVASFPELWGPSVRQGR
ncbi:hypothetical protein GCM10025768_10920 [Microbacterium pseudoresistens]|uniref:Excisionase family DNA binding protein n=1 Tax=Microbacterium pseudoresistens TaxID=640634 RepID=A0A7Y9EXQ7_9MICO|nr:excisionase family DNA binding protein [Microbacterium pseudoresistens]